MCCMLHLYFFWVLKMSLYKEYFTQRNVDAQRPCVRLARSALTPAVIHERKKVARILFAANSLCVLPAYGIPILCLFIIRAGIAK
jgi:hypothetical protein